MPATDTSPPAGDALADDALADDALLTPTTATVDLSAVRHNARLVQQRAAPADLMAVVKADAYGHGAIRVARALRAEGVSHFAVARVPEALELRAAGIEAPIQVFAAPLPEHLPAYARHRLGVTVSSPAIADALVELAAGRAPSAAPIRAHVKVETGMERLGEPPEEAAATVRRLAGTDGVEVAGLWTHFAAAADPEQEAFTRRQLEILQEAAEAAGPLPNGRVHAANTPATMHFEESFRALGPTFVRCGLALYGLTLFPPAVRASLDGAQLRPAMRFSSKITHLKTIEAGASVSYGRGWTAPERVRLATVGCGYGDGYARILSGRAEVGVAGQRFPVVGRICMDLMMVNLGPPADAPPVEVGDEVVLFGPGGPHAQEVADWSETIPYEVATRVTTRVPRRYLGEATATAAATAPRVPAHASSNGHAE